MAVEMAQLDLDTALGRAVDKTVDVFADIGINEACYQCIDDQFAVIGNAAR